MNRDLDAAIAKDVYGYQWIPVSSDFDGKNKCKILYPPGPKPDQDFYSTLPRTGKIHPGWAVPRYTSDLRTAIDLVKKLKVPMTVADMPTDPEKLCIMAMDWFYTGLKKKE